MRLLRRIAIVILCAAPALAADDDAGRALADAGGKLAALPGLRAKIAAHDEVAGRSFEATLVFRAPDRLLAVIPPDDFVLVENGTVVVREGGAVRRADVRGWVADACAKLAPIYADGAALARGTTGAPEPRFADAADHLQLVLALDLRRRDDRVSIALNVVHRCDVLAPPARAPGLAFAFDLEERESPPSVIGLDAERITLRSGRREAVLLRASGVPELALLRSPTGRSEAQVLVKDVEVLAAAPDSLFAAPVALDPAKIENVSPPPFTKEELARSALAALLGRLREGAARDAALLGREKEREKVESVLTRYYAALFRAAYPEAKLREEARRAAHADAPTVEATLSRAGKAGREKALNELRQVFRANCSVHMRDAASELVHLAEAAIGPTDPCATADAEAARRALVAVSGRAALGAFSEAIVTPMEAAAAAELESLASSNGGKP